jgi:hypothetical protein
MPLDPVIVARIVALIQDGRGQRETARIVGKSLCAAQNVYQRYEETGLITRRPGSGRKRITTQRDDRFWCPQVRGIEQLLRFCCEINSKKLEM